ncbi:MAG: hypothetical protein ACRYF4_09445 [Janthinobacterium lividum]
MAHLRRLFCISFLLLLSSSLFAQQTAALPNAEATALSAALAGRWTGVLEYRDYKEPVDSTKRVALPTWLLITAAGQTEAWHYIYDDGPGKVVDEDEMVAFDMVHETCTINQKDKAPRTYQVTGFGTLKAGHGTLVLNGTGTDNHKPSDMRLTLTVGRNLFSLLEEVRLSGTQDAFAYRHLYRFVRADVPVATAK